MDFDQPFAVQMDALEVGLGAVLLQGDLEDKRSVAFLSWKLANGDKIFNR